MFPRAWSCYGSVGLTDPDRCQNSSLLPRSWLSQGKKGKGMERGCEVGRMTEGSEPVGSSLSSSQRRVLVPAAVRLVLPDRQEPLCQTQGPIMTIEAVLHVIAGGASRSANSTSAGLIFRGMGVEMFISSRTKKERKCPYQSDTGTCVQKRTPCRAVACGV